MAEPDAAPQKSGAGCIAGPKKRLHPLTPRPYHRHGPLGLLGGREVGKLPGFSYLYVIAFTLACGPARAANQTFKRECGCFAARRFAYSKSISAFASAWISLMMSTLSRFTIQPDLSEQSRVKSSNLLFPIISLSVTTTQTRRGGVLIAFSRLLRRSRRPQSCPS